MNDTNEKVCRVCLNTIWQNDFDTVDEIVRQMLTSLLNITPDINKSAVICSNCSTKLQNAVDFKTTCLKTENKILTTVNTENNKFWSTEDIFKETTIAKLMGVKEEKNVCRFCLKVAKKECYHYLHEMKEHLLMVDMLQKYIPELHLNASEESSIVTCDTCLALLDSLLSFIVSYLNMEEKIKEEMLQADIAHQSQLNETLDSLQYEINYDAITDIDGNEKGIEYVAVKNELIYEDSWKLDIPELSIKDEEMEMTVEQNDTKSGRDTTNCSDVKTYNCEECPFVTKHKHNLKRHMLTHQNSSKFTVYNCYRCPFQTKHKYTLAMHRQTHRNPLTVTIHNCEKCSFSTNHKSTLKHHMLSHRSPSEEPVYKCDTCTYETKRRYFLKRHSLVHKTNLGIKLYKCEKCTYESNYKNNLQKHLLIHLSPSELDMYKCEFCAFESKRKDVLMKHRLIHQDVSDLILYKCETCLYQTKLKDRLIQHKKTHQDLSSVTIHQCHLCPYGTRRKSNLKRHILTHQNHGKVKQRAVESASS